MLSRTILLLPILVACADVAGETSDPDTPDTVADASTGTADAQPNAPDAAVEDAAPATADAPWWSAAWLGQPCAGGCPEGYECTGISGVEDPSPFCTLRCGGRDDVTTCAWGYAGPGEAGCFLHDGTETLFSCGVNCTDSGNCPGDLRCQEVPGGKICA